jgi:hypothetical protein
MRYYLGVGIVALIVSTAFALAPDGRFYRSRLTLVFTLAILYAVMGWATILAPNRVPAWVSKFFPTYLRDLPLMVRQEDPGVDIIRKLDKILPAGRSLTIDTVSFWSTGDDLGKTVDPWMLTLIARQEGRPWFFSRMVTDLGLDYPGGLNTPAKQLSANNKQYDYSIIGPLGHRADQSDSISILAEFIQDAYGSGRLKALGLKKVALLDGDGRDGARGKFLVVVPSASHLSKHERATDH